jgi:hypothetical protein
LPPRTRRGKRQQPMKGGGLSQRQLTNLAQMLYSTSQAADIDAVREVTEEKLAEDPSFDANAYFKTQVQTLLGLDDVTNPDSTVYDPDGTRATRIRTITAGLDFAAGDATKLARALTDYVPAMSAPLAAKVQELEASNLESIKCGTAEGTAKDFMSHPRESEHWLVKRVSIPFAAPNLLGTIGTVKFVAIPTGDIGIVK